MTFIKSSMYYSIEKVIRLLISLFIASMLAKTLGLSKFGEFSLYISFTTLISFVASFSLDYVSMSEYAKKENIHKKVTNIFFLRILTSVIYLFFITILFFVFFKKGFYEVITLSLMYFFSSSIVIENYYLSLAKGKLISKFRLISFLISSVAKVYIIFNIENNVILYLCFAQIIDSVFLFVVFCFTFKNEFKLSYFDYKYCKYVIKKSLPLILSSALIVIYNRVDQLMINYYLGSESLGLYSIGVRLSDAVNVVIMSIVTSYIPLILEYKNKNNKKFNIEYDKLLKLVLMLLTFGVVVFEFCGEQFLNLAFGKDYVPAFSATLILFISLIFSTMGTTSSHLLISDNLEKYRLYRSVFSLVINVVLNVILIPYIGIVGAAIATLISQLYSGLLGYLFNKKLRYILLLNLKVFIFWNLNDRKS